jgi:hypothetical protein
MPDYYTVKGYGWNAEERAYFVLFLADAKAGAITSKALALKTAKRFRAETGCTPDIIDPQGRYLNESGKEITA